MSSFEWRLSAPETILSSVPGLCDWASHFYSGRRQGLRVPEIQGKQKAVTTAVVKQDKFIPFLKTSEGRLCCRSTAVSAEWATRLCLCQSENHKGLPKPVSPARAKWLSWLYQFKETKNQTTNKQQFKSCLSACLSSQKNIAARPYFLLLLLPLFQTHCIWETKKSPNEKYIQLHPNTGCTATQSEVALRLLGLSWW